MPDLYAINLHLREHLERQWREAVHAPEAAVWLDEAGLLHNYKNGLPLRNLLRAGRIAGQEQHPNEKNGIWWIRRLAKSRDPEAIRQARQRMRRYLPIDRTNLYPDWPLSKPHGLRDIVHLPRDIQPVAGAEACERRIGSGRSSVENRA